MARILLRSPYFLTITTASHLSAKLELTIDGTLRYTIIKNATSNRTVFEIASLSRDYINVDFGGSIAVTDTVNISATWYAYSAVDGGGSQLATATVAHTGLLGYGKFTEAANKELLPDKDPTYVGDCGGDGIIYLPENIAGRIIGVDDDENIIVYSISSSATSLDTSDRTYKITRICKPKYISIKCIYVNKFGMFQEFYFFLKNVEAFSTQQEKFKRNIFDYSTSTYNRFNHQSKVFNKNGRTRVTLNTEYIDECYNEVMQDIMLSEYVWINYDSIWRASTVVTNSLTFKTSVNDGLIQYTLDVEYANDIINNIV